MEQYVSNLNWFDVTLISIVLISTVFALFRGFIKAIFSLITWVASGAAAIALYPHSYGYFSTKIHSEKAAMGVSFLATFIVVFIIIAIINSRILKLLRKVSGGFFDRLLGLCFGAARGALIVCLIFFSISLTSKMLHLGKNPERPGPQWFADAKTYEILDMATSTMLTFAPSDMPGTLEQSVNKFKDITLSAMGEDLESSSNSAKTLNDQQRQLMKQVIATLPQEDLAEIYKKYDGNTAGLSEFERIEIFREILSKYKNYQQDGKIAEGKVIPNDKIQALDDALNAGKPGAGAANPGAESDSETSDSLGYKDRNIKQLDRLIEGVK